MSQPAHGPALAHRDDIQGLRAIAVLTVIASHASIPFMPGGFVGVDVFFVISGFLISQLLFREVERSGRISIPRFYARRARRILPASTLVIIATIIASAIWLSAVDLLTVVRDAVWATFFAANIHFAAVGTDYFAQEEPPSPLQHYWSLSVEEQFYLVWPALLLVLVLVARRRALPRRLVVTVLVVLTGASFAWSVISTTTDPLAAYFSTTARAWELGLGALTALVATTVARRLPSSARGLLCLAGLGLIAFACLVYGDQTPFPGSAAAIPVVGSALVLLAGAGLVSAEDGARQPLPVRALGVRPMRVVGDWSYSLYLWHWPVLIIAERRVGALGFWRTAICLLVVFVLSAATYRLVEQPFRSPIRFPTRKALALYPVAVALVVGCALGGRYYSEYSSGAFGDNPAVTLQNFGVQDPSKFDLDADPTVALVQASVIAARHHMAIPSELEPDILTVRDDEPDVGACNYEKDSRDLCPRGDPDADRSIVVFGNSHGRMWIPAFDKIGAELGYATYYFVKPNCAASLVTVGELVPGSPAWPECDDFRAWALDQIAALHPALVVVSSSGPNPVLYDDAGNRVPKDGVDAATEQGYVDLFTRLAPIADQTVLLRDVPKSEELPDECLTESGNDLGDCLFEPLAASVNDADISEAGAEETGTPVVDPTRWICWDGSCPAVVGNVLPYRDRGHLTTIYAESLADELIEALGLS